MSVAIDYYFSPQSPWTYLGHERFAEIARQRRRDDQRPAGRPRPRLPGLGRAAARQARAAAPGLPPGRAEALQRIPRSAAQPAAALLPGRQRRRGQAHHRRRRARRQRRGDAHRGARSCAASGSRSRTSPTRRCCRRCSAASGLPARRLDDSQSQAVHERYEAGLAARDRQPACSARRPMSSTARCSGARTGSTSSSAAWRAADASLHPVLRLGVLDAGALGVARHGAHFSAATL